MANSIQSTKAYFIRPLITATLVLAISLTISCSSDDGDGGGGTSSPSVGGDPSSSSAVSSSTGGGVSSSSVGGGDPSSSSAAGGGNSSSSGGGSVASSSSAGGSGGSSSSGGGSVVSSSSTATTATGLCPNATTTPVNAEGVGSMSCGGKEYKTVKIGEQVWLAENLNFAAEGSKCGDESTGGLSDENTTACDTYGRLYNWATAVSVCPSGWHLPSKEEWDALISLIESDKSCTSCAGKYLKSATGWDTGSDPVFYKAGVNSYGFSALPGGYGETYGSFDDVGVKGRWWSAYEKNGSAYYRRMQNDSDDLSSHSSEKDRFISVRCIKD